MSIARVNSSDKTLTSPITGTTREMGILLPNNQRQHRTLQIQKDELPYAVCWSLRPESASLASIFQMDSISTSYAFPLLFCFITAVYPAVTVPQ